MFYSSSHGFFRSLILSRILLARLAQSFFFFSFFFLSPPSSCACGGKITCPSFFSLFFEHQQTLSEEHFYEKNIVLTFHFALRLLESQCSSIIIIFICFHLLTIIRKLLDDLRQKKLKMLQSY